MRGIPQLNVQTRKAIRQEANRQVSAAVQGCSINILSLVLWYMHIKKGYGKKRLIQMYLEIEPFIKELRDFYEMDDPDGAAFICCHKLKEEVGIDIEEIPSQFKIVAIDKHTNKVIKR
jgi:hypothetical protein